MSNNVGRVISKPDRIPTLRVSEFFYSIQGEGKYCGAPSVFLRLYGCNFTCQGFANPELKEPPVNNIKLVDLDPNDFAFGCDTRYAWAKEYYSTTKRYTADRLCEELKNLIPNSVRPHLVITGGEPLLQQKGLIPFLREAFRQDLFSTVTFETNGSLFLDKWFVATILSSYGPSRLLFSNSVKLSHSGEPKDKRINFEALTSQFGILPEQPLRKTVLEYPDYQVFKFVVRPVTQDFEELLSFITDYAHHLSIRYRLLSNGNLVSDISQMLRDRTWVMPLGADADQLKTNSLKVAELAMQTGLNYSPRLHVDLFGNTVGT